MDGYPFYLRALAVNCISPEEPADGEQNGNLLFLTDCV